MFQDSGAARCRCAVPARLRGCSAGQRRLHGVRISRVPLPNRLPAIRRIQYRLAGRADQRTRHQRRRFPGFDRGVELLGQLAQIVVVGEIGAHGVFPVLVLTTQQIGRQWNLGMRNGSERRHRLNWVADEVFDGDILVGDAIDEAGIGAVFEQATHQIGQQIFV